MSEDHKASTVMSDTVSEVESSHETYSGLRRGSKGNKIFKVLITVITAATLCVGIAIIVVLVHKHKSPANLHPSRSLFKRFSGDEALKYAKAGGVLITALSGLIGTITGLIVAVNAGKSTTVTVTEVTHDTRSFERSLLSSAVQPFTSIGDASTSPKAWLFDLDLGWHVYNGTISTGDTLITELRVKDGSFRAKIHPVSAKRNEQGTGIEASYDISQEDNYTDQTDGDWSNAVAASINLMADNLYAGACFFMTDDSDNLNGFLNLVEVDSDGNDFVQMECNSGSPNCGSTEC